MTIQSTLIQETTKEFEFADAPVIIAAEVSLEDYMEHYAELGCEWVEGTVYKVTPIGLYHEDIRDYVRDLLRIFLVFKPMGRVLGEPFVMRLPAFPKRRREPDLMVILNTNPHTLEDTYMNGPADICIEIVSPGSVSVDHGDKFVEYEKGGVTEYWILDSIRQEARFYRLNENGIYIRYTEDETGNYTTPQLPGLMIHVPTLWVQPHPNPVEIVETLRQMLKE